VQVSTFHVTAGLSLFFRLSSLKRDRFIVSVFHTSYCFLFCLCYRDGENTKESWEGQSGGGWGGRAAQAGARGTPLVPAVVLPLRPVRETKAVTEARLEAEAAAAEQAKAAAARAADPPPKKKRGRKADKSVVQPKDKTPDGKGSENAVCFLFGGREGLF
jgi:hypothetical protein